MKILYIENIRLPTEKAHGIQIMKMCEAFANNNAEVVLLVPKRKNNIEADPFTYYEVNKNFKLERVWVPNILFLGPIGFWLQSLYFAERSAWYMWSFRPDIVYSREERILFNLIFVVKNMIWESHQGSWNLASKMVSKFSKKIVVISHGLSKFYNSKSANLSKKIIVAPDGVDIDKFNIQISKEECRKRLSLSLDKKIILYSGHLYDWKGAQFLADASLKFNNDELAVFVGGTDHDISKFKIKNENNKNILILGQKKYSEIPYYLKSADVLVLPNSSKEKISSTYTSPLKLFEYMASGTPIVASSLDSIREVLDSNTAVLVPSDSSDGIYDGVQKVLNDRELSSKISARALLKVKNMTWFNRARDILSGLSI